AGAVPTAAVGAQGGACARACTHGDVSGVVRLYTDDATVIWPGEPEETRNRAALQRLVADACRPDRGLEMAVDGLEVIWLDATHVAAVLHWRGAPRGPGGHPISFPLPPAPGAPEAQGGRGLLVGHPPPRFSAAPPPPRAP